MPNGPLSPYISFLKCLIIFWLSNERFEELPQVVCVSLHVNCGSQKHKICMYSGCGDMYVYAAFLSFPTWQGPTHNDGGYRHISEIHVFLCTLESTKKQVHIFKSMPGVNCFLAPLCVMESSELL